MTTPIMTACWSGFPGTTGKNSLFCFSGKRIRKKAARKMRTAFFSIVVSDGQLL